MRCPKELFYILMCWINFKLTWKHSLDLHRIRCVPRVGESLDISNARHNPEQCKCTDQIWMRFCFEVEYFDFNNCIVNNSGDKCVLNMPFCFCVVSNWISFTVIFGFQLDLIYSYLKFVNEIQTRYTFFSHTFYSLTATNIKYS